jgi:hypothetical protein
VVPVDGDQTLLKQLRQAFQRRLHILLLIALDRLAFGLMISVANRHGRYAVKVALVQGVDAHIPCVPVGLGRFAYAEDVVGGRESTIDLVRRAIRANATIQCGKNHGTQIRGHLATGKVSEDRKAR